MAKVEMVAGDSIFHGGVTVLKGQPFTVASEKDADKLEKLGHVKAENHTKATPKAVKPPAAKVVKSAPENKGAGKKTPPAGKPAKAAVTPSTGDKGDLA